MPRSLRWMAAITTGIVTQFVFQIAFLAIVSHGGKLTINQGDAKVAFGGIVATIVNLLSALAVNDWLSKRYPREAKAPQEEMERSPTNVG